MRTDRVKGQHKKGQEEAFTDKSEQEKKIISPMVC
jgi:hypothetical protein